jgi:hypothetical protein
MQSHCTFRENSYSHAGHHSVSVSVCSTAGLWASDRRCREPGLAAAAGRIQEEPQTACVNAMGSVVLGRSIPCLGLLARRAGLRSARYRGPLATGTFSQILGSAVTAQSWSSRPTCRCQRSPKVDPADGHRQSPVASSETSWRVEDAWHHNIGANRLTDSADRSTAAFSDLEDVSPEPFGSDCIG